jgi:hypothetical protein
MKLVCGFGLQVFPAALIVLIIVIYAVSLKLLGLKGFVSAVSASPLCFSYAQRWPWFHRKLEAAER